MSILGTPDSHTLSVYDVKLSMQLYLQDGMKGGHLMAEVQGLSKPKAAWRFLQEQDRTAMPADSIAATTEVRLRCHAVWACLSCL
jgi:hypothetical protein